MQSGSPLIFVENLKVSVFKALQPIMFTFSLFPLAELNPFLNFLYREFDSSWFYLIQIILILQSIRNSAIKKLSVLCYQPNTKKAVPPNTLAPYALSQLAEKNYPLQEL